MTPKQNIKDSGEEHTKVSPFLINLVETRLLLNSQSNEGFDNLNYAEKREDLVNRIDAYSSQRVIPKFACYFKGCENKYGRLTHVSLGESSETNGFQELIDLDFNNANNRHRTFNKEEMYIDFDGWKSNDLRDVAAEHCIQGKDPFKLLTKFTYLSPSGKDKSIYVPVPHLEQVFCLGEEYIPTCLEGELEGIKFEFFKIFNNKNPTLYSGPIPLVVNRERKDIPALSYGEDCKEDRGYIEIPKKYESLEEAVRN